MPESSRAIYEVLALSAFAVAWVVAPIVCRAWRVAWRLPPGAAKREQLLERARFGLGVVLLTAGVGFNRSWWLLRDWSRQLGLDAEPLRNLWPLHLFALLSIIGAYLLIRAFTQDAKGERCALWWGAAMVAVYLWELLT